jgi:hypothetical protein
VDFPPRENLAHLSDILVIVGKIMKIIFWDTKSENGKDGKK